MTAYLTTEEMAEQLRLTPETLRTYVRAGIVPAIRLKPKVLRFDPDAVAAAMAALATKPREAAHA